jgi:hypothetical protein
MVAMSLSSVSVIGNALRLRGEAYNLVSPAACSRSRRCSGASGEHLSKAVTGAATGSKSKVFVWLLMVVFRNIAFIRGKVSERYFQTFTVDAPAEWVERPTRAYMNLLELPILFYVAAALMLITQTFDSVQVSLAWLFVFTRCAHAFIYIAFNYIPLRFVSYLTGVITLGVLWARFAEQSL